MSSVDIQGNFADQGGGLYLDEDSSVDYATSWVEENDATDGGGVQVDGGYLSMENVILAWNLAVEAAGWARRARAAEGQGS